MRESEDTQHGSIAVAIGADATEIWVSVADNGIGLPQEDRFRLAEPYVTHKPKGTGLGLAIVKKIMEDHGGRLVLEDNPNGCGAMASLCLTAASLAVTSTLASDEYASDSMKGGDSDGA
jgi:two-component system nitrogen regulation sensor histidine kinase NtrY